MYNSKLFRYYKTLTDVESREWLDFVHSSFANSNDGVRLLGTLLHKGRKTLSDSIFDQEQAFFHCFPKSSHYNIGKMRKTMTQTLKSIEDYWVFHKLQQDPIRKRQYLAEALLEKELNYQYEKTLKAIIKDIKTEDIHSFGQGVILYESYLNLFDNQSKLSHNTAQSDLTNATTYLQQSYLLKDRILKAIWINRNNLLNADVPANVITDNPTLSFPILDLTERIISLISNSDKKNKGDFEVIINSLDNPGIKDSQHLEVLYRILINYAIIQQRNNQDYGQYIYKLYTTGLNNEIFQKNGKLPASVFINMCVTLGQMGKIKEAQSFINQFSARLSRSDNESKILAHAYVYYYNGQFRNCYSTLHQIQFANPRWELSRRPLLVRSSFECYGLDQGIFKNTINLIDNFRNYIRRNSTSSKLSQPTFKEYLAYCRRLFLIMSRPSINTNILDRLIVDVKKSELMVPSTKKWLLDYIDRKTQRG